MTKAISETRQPIRSPIYSLLKTGPKSLESLVFELHGVDKKSRSYLHRRDSVVRAISRLRHENKIPIHYDCMNKRYSIIDLSMKS